MALTGIVDVGSGTARLVVFEHHKDSWYRLVDEMREPVRLGSGVAASGKLSAAAIERTLSFLNAVRDYTTILGVDEVAAYATSAVRRASNSEELLSRAEKLGLPLKVLSGEEEARFGVHAVLGGFSLSDAWVMDLGGGSAQLSLMQKRSFTLGKAYPLGAVRLSERFFRHDPPKAREVKSLEREVRQQLASRCKSIADSGLPLVAMGGTVRNLARAVQRHKRYPLERLHGYFLRRDDLEELSERLARSNSSQRRRVPGISPDRADVILAGALVYRTLLEEADLPGLWISGFGIREGAFFDRFLPADFTADDVAELHLRNLESRFKQPQRHVASVRRLAMALFDGLQRLHWLGEGERRLLDAAARLHDIGLMIDFYDHHKHGSYLLQNHLLAGWSHREHALLSLLVRYHRKGKPSAGALRSLMREGDEALLGRLAAILRLAEHLERARSGRVRGLEIAIEEDAVTVRLVGSENLWVELWEARKDARLFKKFFGLPLKLVAAGQPL